MGTDLGARPQPPAEREGFVVPPDRAARFASPRGREADVTEVLATREQTGAALGLFRQTIAPGAGRPPTSIGRRTSSSTSSVGSSASGWASAS